MEIDNCVQFVAQGKRRLTTEDEDLSCKKMRVESDLYSHLGEKELDLVRSLKNNGKSYLSSRIEVTPFNENGIDFKTHLFFVHYLFNGSHDEDIYESIEDCSKGTSTPYRLSVTFREKFND